MAKLSKGLGEQWGWLPQVEKKHELLFEERATLSFLWHEIITALQSAKTEPYILVVAKSKRFAKALKQPTSDDPLAAVWDRVRNQVEAILREHLGNRVRILGYEKSIEEDDYAIYVEVPLEIYRDLDLTSSVGGRIIALSDDMGIPFFCYFVPARNEGVPEQ